MQFGGHGGKLERFEAERLQSVGAFDNQGGTLQVARIADADGVLLRIDGSTPALIAAHYDNGIHTRTPQGPSVLRPMNEVPGATRASHAVKYHKTILDWSAFTVSALGQPFEVVPVESRAPRANQAFRVKVLRDGRPVPGVRLGHGEEGGKSAPVTDEQGIATFTPVSGLNKLWAGKRFAVENEPRYTELSYEYVLGFYADWLQSPWS